MASFRASFSVKRGLPVAAKRISRAFKRMAVRIAKI